MDTPEVSNLNALKIESLDDRRPVAKVAHIESRTCDRIFVQMALISFLLDFTRRDLRLGG